ncbi:MAG TPA: hypothetical protein VF746_29275 [Longimicrobium sp.]|jgi:hypothetical protein
MPRTSRNAVAEQPRREAAWECFHRSISQSLALWPGVHAMPAHEDHADPMVRAMQRARRQTWLHARHVLGWSMFESIRIATRLAEVFAEWTRGAGPWLDELGTWLEEVERQARQPSAASLELRFVDHLMDSARSTDFRLAEIDLALDAFRRAEEGQRRAAAG